MRYKLSSNSTNVEYTFTLLGLEIGAKRTHTDHTDPIMAITRNTAICTVTAVTAVLFLSLYVHLSHSNIFHSGIHPEHVDPNIMVPPVNVTYIRETNTLIIDAAKEWELQSHTPYIRTLDYIVWVFSLGTSTLVYAPYSKFQEILARSNLNHTAVIIEVSGPHISVIEKRASKDCDLEQSYISSLPSGVLPAPKIVTSTGSAQDVNLGTYYQHGSNLYKLFRCARYSGEVMYRTDSFNLKVDGNLEGYENYYGGSVANPAEIASSLVLKFISAVWFWTVAAVVISYYWNTPMSDLYPTHQS